MDNFTKALNFTLTWEGGYVNDPNDPGGETKFGISKRAYPNVDIKNLTRDQASEIYKNDYWTPLNCDSFDLQLACVVFDSAVNCGLHRVAIWMDNENNTAASLLDQREAYYKDLANRKPLEAKFLKGWLNRTQALRDYIGGLS